MRNVNIKLDIYEQKQKKILVVVGSVYRINLNKKLDKNKNYVSAIILKKKNLKE